jgi:hypothetical protein
MKPVTSHPSDSTKPTTAGPTPSSADVASRHTVRLGQDPEASPVVACDAAVAKRDEQDLVCVLVEARRRIERA